MLTVIHLFSRILAVFGILMLAPIGVGWWYGNDIMPFAKAVGITMPIAAVLWLLTEKYVNELHSRGGFLLAFITWGLLPVFAAIPIYFYLPELGLSGAYFEATSGLTTTGATIIIGLDKLPEALNFWRAFLLWLGGMGIIVLSVAILPLLGVGGSQIFKAETPGPMKDTKLTPRITQTAKGLWLVYFLITVACGFCYWLAGMSKIDSIVHAFSTIALGGFSSHDASFAFWNSTSIDTVAIVFMLISGINFSTHFQAFHSFSLKPYKHDIETRWFLKIVLGAAVCIAVYLWRIGVYDELSTSLHFSIFNVVSVATTTGFANTDFGLWPIVLPFFMLILACFVTAAGSTGSGIKMIRAIVLMKQFANELTRSVHSNAYVSVKVGGRVVSPRIVFSILTFFFVYVLVLVILTIVLSASGLDPTTALSAAIAGLNNIGPGLNELGPSFTYVVLNKFQLGVLTFAMLLGRLELFSIFVVFTPAFWRA